MREMAGELLGAGSEVAGGLVIVIVVNVVLDGSFISSADHAV